MSAPAPPQLCPSCAGQIQVGAASCPWCGVSLGATDVTRVGPSPSSSRASTPDIGFGGPSRPLPPLPPPPKSLPLVRLNPTQVFLRVLIILCAAYVAVAVGQHLLKASVCAVPSPMCRR